MGNNTLAAIVIGAVVIIGGFVLYNSYYNGASPAATTTPTGGNTTPTPTPTPSPTASVPFVITESETFVSNSTALVTGKVTPNGAQTMYWYEYGLTTALGGRTSSQAIGSGFIPIPAPAYITGLSANTPYFYRVSAQNAYGAANGTIRSFTTNTTPPPPGTAPTISTDSATDISRTTANLNGRVDPNNSPSSFWFEYGETSELGSATALQAAGSGNTSLPATVSISNLRPQTKYFFRLNAQSQFGTVNGAIRNFMTVGPPAPGIPKADTTNPSNVATSSVTMKGAVNPNGAETRYWFEYGVDSLLGSILGSTTKTNVAGSGTENVQVSTNVSGLNRNTRYYYRVIAENSYGLTRGDIANFKTDN